MSLLMLVASLVLSLVEVRLSTRALAIQLKNMER